MNLSPTAWIEAIEKHLGRTKGWLQMHERIRALEDRVAALEQGGHDQSPVCDHCGSRRLTRTGTRKQPGPFGVLGVKEAIWHCDDCQKDSFIETPPPPP